MKDKTAKDTVYTPEEGNRFIPKTSGEKEYDLLISKGIVYDGSGNPGMEVDVGIKGDMIVQIGKNLKKSKAKSVIEANGLAVSPGFIDPPQPHGYRTACKSKRRKQNQTGSNHRDRGKLWFFSFSTI